MSKISGANAVFSPCGAFRLRLEREVQAEGIVALFVGINPSVANSDDADQTTKKWMGFSLKNGFRRYIAVNVHGLVSRDVSVLAEAVDPIGPGNMEAIRDALRDCDVVIPCWGNRSKVPPRLHSQIARVLTLIRSSRKPVKVFGLTHSGDPKHPLMLGYATKLVDWSACA